jgi:DNA-binding CsgD family transcriptional regulator
VLYERRFPVTISQNCPDTWATLLIDVAEGIAVEKHTAVSDPADRLLELLSSFSRLRNNHRTLVSQIRGSIGELRQLRRQLRSQSVSNHPGGNGNLEEATLERRFGLTRREVQVAIRLAQGRSNQAIARDLQISAHTARHHTQRILFKLGVHSRGEAGAKIRG